MLLEVLKNLSIRYELHLNITTQLDAYLNHIQENIKNS